MMLMVKINMGLISFLKDTYFPSLIVIILANHVSVEIEIIVFLVGLTDSSIICKKLLYYIEIILKILQNTTILLTNTIINKLKLNYNNLIKNKNNDIFIAASPVTIHRENLIKSDTIKNIYNKYAVTLKADGDRNFLIVHSSKNKSENGKIYIFNNNFNFIDTVYKDDEWVDTLIECEFIDNKGDSDSNSKELYICSVNWLLSVII
jgi:hypothetical protein